MERSYLESLEIKDGKLTKEQIDAIMSTNGKDIQREQAKVTALEVERDTLRTSLQEKINENTALQKDSSKDALAALQKKYDDDVAALNKQITDDKRSRVKDAFFKDVEFTSELAKKAVLGAFDEKNFELVEKDGKQEFTGAREWLDQMKKDNADGFKVVEQPNTNNQNNNQQGGQKGPYFPSFSSPTTKNNSQGGNSENGPFNFGFSHLREE